MPILTKEYASTDEMFAISYEIVKKNKIAKVGDNIVITCGTPLKNGGTNLIKVNKIN